MILKARAYRDAIPGPRRSILILNPKHDHSPQSCISQRGYNIEFSCAAESLDPDGSMEQSSVFRTEPKASAATNCYTQEYSSSYWSFTYPAASCGNRRGRYRQMNISNHTNLALPAYSSNWTKAILVEERFPRKQIALILKARAYRDAK